MRWFDFTAKNLLWPILLLGGVGCGSGAPPISGRVEQETLVSAIVNDSYLILVRLPPAYDANRTQTYPVAYQLDATSFGPEFDITAGLASGLESKGTIGSRAKFHTTVSGGCNQWEHSGGQKRSVTSG